MLSRLFLILLTSSFSLLAGAQENLLSKEQVIADNREIVEFYSSVHPNAWMRCDSLEFIQYLDSVPLVDDYVHSKDYHLHVVRAVNKLRDGHSFVSLKGYPNAEKIAEQAVDTPIQIKGERVFTLDKNGESIELRQIDGKPSDVLVSELFKLVSGEERPYREAMLESDFAFLYQLQYGMTESVGLDDGLALNFVQKRDRPDYAVVQINDTTVALQLNTFSFSNQEAEQYGHFIDSCFQSWRTGPIKHVLIDIGANQGGNSSYGDRVMDHVVNKAYSTYETQSLKRSRISKRYFRKRFIPWYLYPVAIFSKQARLVALKKNGEEELSTEPRNPKERGGIFSEQVTLITSSSSYSAAGTFAVSFKNSGRGQILGESPGQPCAGFIDLIPIRLAHSNILCVSSFKSYQYIGCSTQQLEVDRRLTRNMGELDIAYYKRLIALD